VDAVLARVRCVLAVRDLERSTRFYTEMLGFTKDPVDADSWSFISRDNFRLMLGECPDERPAGELGNHSYFAYVEMDRIDRYHDEVVAKGVEVVSELESKPWGMREFGIRTIDGHRILFGQGVGSPAKD
jgi:catechol 2,3-dioxygenase-like lactoylglutathione lyase family enzyme